MTDAQDASEPPPQAKATVLLATSDSATRNLLRRILHVGAIDIIDAADGVEALALTRRLDLDLILLDAFLAVVDGISVCERIHALPDVEPPPIIIVGLSSERAVEIALAGGADATITKPLNLALIRHHTRMLLKRRMAEKHLRLAQRALETAPVGLTILDARSSEYSLSFSNAAFLQLTGYTPEEIRGRNLRLLKGPDTDVAAMTELRDSFAEGRGCRILIKNYRKDGQPFWNDLIAAPMLDVSGRLTHYVAVQHDVTTLVQAPEHAAERALDNVVAERTRDLDQALTRVEERRRFTETILNSMVSSLLATDAKGIVTFANRAGLRTLGASLADCVGRSIVEIFGHNEELVDVISGQATLHQEYRLDFPFISPGGERFYVGMSITRAPEELRDEIGFIFLFRNLAETIEDESDPRLQQLAADERTAAAKAALEAAERLPRPRAGEDTSGATESGEQGAALVAPGAEARGTEEEPPRRRAQLALRYCSPADLAKRAIDSLASELKVRLPPIQVEAAEPLPDVLVDRQQIIDAIAKLVISAMRRCNDPSQVRLQLNSTEAAGDKGVQRRASVHFDVLFPRAQITEQDLGSDIDAAARHTYRHADLASVEMLVEANGGRLLHPVRDSDTQSLTILLPAAK